MIVCDLYPLAVIAPAVLFHSFYPSTGSVVPQGLHNDWRTPAVVVDWHHITLESSRVLDLRHPTRHLYATDSPSVLGDRHSGTGRKNLHHDSAIGAWGARSL